MHRIIEIIKLYNLDYIVIDIDKYYTKFLSIINTHEIFVYLIIYYVIPYYIQNIHQLSIQ